MKSRVPASLQVIGRSIADWWDSWLDMVLLSIVWFFAQLTIVLGPPATFGFYYVVHQMLNGELLGVRGMIQGGKKYFWKSLLWGLINLGVLILVYVNIQFYGNIEAVWGLYLQIFMILMGLLWISTQFYALPYFMELQVKKLRYALKNGVLTTLGAPFFTLILIFTALVLGTVSIVIIIPIFLGVLGIIPLLGFRGMYDRLVTFGLIEREKTPKEIEAEESGKIEVKGMNWKSDEKAKSVNDTDGEGPEGLPK